MLIEVLLGVCPKRLAGFGVTPVSRDDGNRFYVLHGGHRGKHARHSLTGATLALDDFGTGYSSLGYLATFRLDKLKLDRSFTTGLGTDPSALAILRSVGDLCRGLGIGLLCEGVETVQHLEILRANGCDEAQGYLYAKPLKFGDFFEHAEANLAASEASHRLFCR